MTVRKTRLSLFICIVPMGKITIWQIIRVYIKQNLYYNNSIYRCLSTWLLLKWYYSREVVLLAISTCTDTHPSKLALAVTTFWSRASFFGVKVH